ncbi:MAG: murein biosynthesis integral membrane protein MurJ [Chloroflexi bacterium]|nr:murein biosynthesis integral membrane protein MurJ [Chloroflexota bacterium]MQC26748.1 murein biosynthesis integral membrane protein MurJ [Chloroflexota bacterium]
MSHFARSSIIIAIFFGIDKILAFGRQLIVNNLFGLSYQLDVFNAANNVPDLLSALISGGALGVALIPVLSEYLEKRGRPEAWLLFTRILNLAFIITGAIAILIAIFATPIINNIIAPGFPAEQRALAAELMRIDLIAILIFSISGLAMAGLQANQHFILPALAPALYNIGQIFGALILAPETPFSIGHITFPAFGLGVHGLVYGVVLGSLLHLAIQLPGLRHYGWRWQATLGLATPGVRKVLRLLGPRVATMLFIHFYFLARDNLGSFLGEGSVTAINLGWFIMQVPETLLGTAVAIAILPSIAEIFSLGDLAKFRDTVNGTLRAILAFTIPSAVILAVGLRPLVAAGFSAFTPEQVDLVVTVTRLYLLGLTGHALLEIAVRSFYAQQNAITPLFAAALNAAGFFVFAKLLSASMGAAGIALAATISFSLEALLLLWLLGRNYKGLLALRPTLIRVLFVSIAAGLAVLAVLRYAPIPPVFASLSGMLLALFAVIPFILPELRTFARLGAQSE